mgnify:FL=1|tara:strand:- start:963 stop:1496 length:534 start_codon:yes stop_codon:yes gene_type:complete
MFFKNFPAIPYDSLGNYNFKEVTNLLRRIVVRSKVKTNTLMFDTYDIRDGETPEMLADKLYDDPELHWVILMMNDITDRFHQWPMNSVQFNTYVEEKYSNINAIHHYEIAQSSGDTTTKIWVENDTDASAYSDTTPITNYEYELREQDRKRKIRLLDPRYLDQFVQEFQTKMRESII